ncbi:MAG: hypothetical protein ABL914_10160 [Novosphingobium sp.]|uniref:hypothetical protein n=1 Tax=Novosphingobium sp. TaxID=1874826 RepID=UPI0032BC0143
MAKQKRTPINRKPITSHQLFPAVVALWFGALFGLGSLAIRPSLIENLVLSSRLDLMVPAAAPPLGVTARIIIALVLAAIGAMAGAVLARRLIRPKVEHKERNRSARGIASTRAPNTSRSAYGDAPACKPISMDDLGEGGPADAASSQIAGRRRGLTADHEEVQFVPHEFAPLPGGAPQILDLGMQGPAMPVPEAPLAAAAPVLGQMPPALPQMSPADLAPPIAADFQRQVFQAEQAQPAVAISPDSIAAHADGRQVFGMEPVVAQEDQPRQIFGIAASGDHVPQDFIREAGYSTTVFETETAPPLFERDLTQADPQAAPISAVPALPAAEVAAQPAEPLLPSPASLGMTDLASRLAESMRRRRAAKGAAGSQEQTAVEASQPVAAQDFAAPPVPEPVLAEVLAPAPVAIEPAMPPIPAFTASVPMPFEAPPALVPAELDNLPVPSANEAPVAPAPIAELPIAAVAAAQLPIALPNALRPLALDAFLEDDSPLDLGLLPPRHIAMPAAPQPISPAPQPVAFEAPIEEEPVEEPIAEENYGSLLGIAQPRAGFVRIEEPEVNNADPEPVVIFPGQSAFGAAAPLAPIAADTGEFRRFDGPGAAGHGQPLAADMPVSAVDSGAADQALRSALANLQRMSGAA